MQNKEFSFFSSNIDFLKILIDLAFLLLNGRLFHSSMQYGKKVLLKNFVLDGNGLIIAEVADLNG